MTFRELETPALTADLKLMGANLERVAAIFQRAPACLRLFFKNHKCPRLAARQLAATTLGITSATQRGRNRATRVLVDLNAVEGGRWFRGLLGAADCATRALRQPEVVTA